MEITNAVEVRKPRVCRTPSSHLFQTSSFFIYKRREVCITIIFVHHQPARQNSTSNSLFIKSIACLLPVAPSSFSAELEKYLPKPRPSSTPHRILFSWPRGPAETIVAPLPPQASHHVNSTGSIPPPTALPSSTLPISKRCSWLRRRSSIVSMS